jgi:putative membrane-bound dehydrogenase-like protein
VYALLIAYLAITAADAPNSPSDSLNVLHAPEGITVQLVAAEPDIADPVAMAFDEQGRLYVVENRGYPEDDSGAGRIALLTDDDRDGRYTRQSTFYDGLQFPNGVMPWQGGVIVTDAPRVLHLKDTTGDGVADTETVLLDGFSLGGSTQLRVSHPTLGLDNWIHFTNGLSGGEVRLNETDEPVKMGLNDLRFNPFTKALELEGGRAQFGLTFDDFGRKFVCSNRNHIQHVVLDPQDLARNPALPFARTAHDIPEHGAASTVYPLTGAPTTAYAHAGTFTAACGLSIYRGDALPDAYHGNAFVCEPTGNLVHRDIIEPAGGTFTSHRGRDGVEFLASEDDWFRPVFTTNGPDGALYVCDMYRGTIEHPTYLPGDVAAVTDFEAGKGLGRIYRVTVENREAAFPALNADNPATLVAQLATPNGWLRDTAHRLLLERQSDDVIPDLRERLQSNQSASTTVHALSLLDAFNALTNQDLLIALKNDTAEVREFAVRLIRERGQVTSDLQEAIQKRARDPDNHVRFHVALTLGDLETPPYPALVDVLLASNGDEWTEAAVLSGISGGAAAFTDAYLAALEQREPAKPVMATLGYMLAADASRDAALESIAHVLDRAEPEQSNWAMAYLNGVLDGARRGQALQDAGTIEALRENLPPESQTTLDNILNEALTLASSAPDAVQSTAIELLGRSNSPSSQQTLKSLLSPQTPAALQTEAVRSLFRAHSADAVAVVLDADRWNAFPGEARTAALDGLLANEDGVKALVEAVTAGGVPAWTVPPQYRARILRTKDPEVQAAAKAAFETGESTDRIAVYESFRPILETAGDAANGATVFEKTCASCHVFSEKGNEVGPDLTGIASQSSDSILLHILVPNWLRLPGYESYAVETADFEAFTGIIVAESDSSITLRAAYGVEHHVPRDSITHMELSAMSMMPAELEKTMTKQELRDLIAYLKREK